MQLLIIIYYFCSIPLASDSLEIGASNIFQLYVFVLKGAEIMFHSLLLLIDFLQKANPTWRWASNKEEETKQKSIQFDSHE